MKINVDYNTLGNEIKKSIALNAKISVAKHNLRLTTNYLNYVVINIPEEKTLIAYAEKQVEECKNNLRNLLK